MEQIIQLNSLLAAIKNKSNLFYTFLAGNTTGANTNTTSENTARAAMTTTATTVDGKQYFV